MASLLHNLVARVGHLGPIDSRHHVPVVEEPAPKSFYYLNEIDRLGSNDLLNCYLVDGQNLVLSLQNFSDLAGRRLEHSPS